MRVVVLVPYRADNGRRDTIWNFVAARWRDESPWWELHVGVDDHGPFNRSLAINRAAKAAGSWDVAVIADADSIVAHDQIMTAVRTAHSTQLLTLAYERYNYLRPEMSDAVMTGFRGDWYAGVDFSMTNTCSSMVVVPRAVWDRVGGFDEGFVGWGGEDVAFSLAAQILGGGYERVPGELWHLWHPPAPHDHNDSNMPRMKLYADARDAGPEAMRRLLVELHVIAEDGWPV